VVMLFRRVWHPGRPRSDMIPVRWQNDLERIRREPQTGSALQAVLDLMKEQGARAKLFVMIASRRNPTSPVYAHFPAVLRQSNAPETG